ncbi:DUF3027 domain-containing protein [Microbacterium sp. KSW-18]|uniref:DUF3027 domain-containing protein n=1 Tax=Microbacterium aquilitoris TaxID=3067307 RepID=A0ABU3GJW6_9MICO|nr:DUF3027 domain-containing protein [Microbacterium sp. KSW-18]MDT3330724.1 DUF3027 domain-containing protein [Microbacterium sp. KSW-18]
MPESTEPAEPDTASVESADAPVEQTEASAPTDPRLFEAHDLARAALLEVTPEATVGDAAGYQLEDGGVVSLRFANRMAGYPGWFWTVSVAVVEGSDPTVLEVELMPGDGALLAPEWLPWAERLAEYQAAQAASGENTSDEDDDVDDDDEDADEDDADEDDADGEDLDAGDFESDGSPILHAGDVDGVDIDELDESEDDVSSDEDDDESDEDESDDDDDDDDDENDDDENAEVLREY